MAGKRGLLVTLPTEFHSKPCPAQGGWGVILMRSFLSSLDPESPAVLRLPFTTCTYFLTITSTSRYLWASPQHSPELSTKLRRPGTSPGEGCPHGP